MKTLFYECAFKNDWKVAGINTDYKFIEKSDTSIIYIKGYKNKEQKNVEA